MPKKTLGFAIVIVVIVAVVGGYFAFHKSKAPANTGTSNNSSSSNAAAVHNSLLQAKTDSSLGQYLTDPNGKPLYTYGGDTTGVSNCTGTCLESWPAYRATTSTASLPANIGTITRTDNSQVQYTYKGKPLYYFVSDSGSTVTGNGVGNFEVARP